jgi:hypothetical protein
VAFADDPCKTALGLLNTAAFALTYVWGDLPTDLLQELGESVDEARAAWLECMGRS